MHTPRIVQNDDILLYGLARYFGIKKGRVRGTASVAATNLLLTLYRVKGPITRNELMELAGLSHVVPITFRTYIFTLRQALGHDAIYIIGYHYHLSFEARKDIDKAFEFIREELEEAINPQHRKTVMAIVRAEAVA